MKAEELRINNWISIPQYGSTDNIVTLVTSDIISSLVSNDLHSDRFEAIPITEEWLLKFGFEKYKGEISYDKGKLSIYLGETILSGELGRTYFNGWAILEYSPKYIHQLQNLYFALKGEELTINQ